MASSTDDVRLLSNERIEQSAVPQCFSWYPPIVKENFLVVVNDQVYTVDHFCFVVFVVVVCLYVFAILFACFLLLFFFSVLVTRSAFFCLFVDLLFVCLLVIICSSVSRI